MSLELSTNVVIRDEASVRIWDRYLILGQTGCGKSSIANALWHNSVDPAKLRQPAKTSGGMNSATIKSNSYFLPERRCVIQDTVGFTDRVTDKEQQEELLKQIYNQTTQPFNNILFVIPFGRINQATLDSFTSLSIRFEPEALDSVIFVITYCDVKAKNWESLITENGDGTNPLLDQLLAVKSAESSEGGDKPSRIVMGTLIAEDNEEEDANFRIKRQQFLNTLTRSMDTHQRVTRPKLIEFVEFKKDFDSKRFLLGVMKSAFDALVRSDMLSTDAFVREPLMLAVVFSGYFLYFLVRNSIMDQEKLLLREKCLPPTDGYFALCSHCFKNDYTDREVVYAPNCAHCYHSQCWEIIEAVGVCEICNVARHSPDNPPLPSTDTADNNTTASNTINATAVAGAATTPRPTTASTASTITDATEASVENATAAGEEQRIASDYFLNPTLADRLQLCNSDNLMMPMSPLKGLFETMGPPIGCFQAIEAIFSFPDIAVTNANKEVLLSAAEVAMERASLMPLPEGLAVDEAAMITLYTMDLFPSETSYYRIVNNALRTENRKQVKPFVHSIWLLIHALKRLPPFTRHVVFRTLPEDFSGRIKLDRKVPITWSAFTSCSESFVNFNNPMFFGNGQRTCFTITLTSGRARSIAPLSYLAEEDEVLLPPNSMFQVRSVFGPQNGRVDIHLEEIAPRDPILDF